MKYLYSRVSTQEQSLARQIDGREDYTIISDKGTGSKINVNLQTLLDNLTSDDSITVKSLDRLGRNTIQTLEIIEIIKKKKASFLSEKENIRIDKGIINITSQMVLAILASIAEFEKSTINERVKQGMNTIQAKINMSKRPTSVHKSRLLNDKEFVYYLNNNIISNCASKYNMSTRTIKRYRKTLNIV